MIEIISAFEREIVVVHNAEPEVDVFHAIIEQIQASSLEHCEKGKRIVVITDFSYKPDITIILSECSANDDIKGFLRKVRHALCFMDDLTDKMRSVVRLIDQNL